MTHTPTYERTVDLFVETSSHFVEAVGALAPSDWDRPGLGEWNVRELVAHTLRAFSTIDNFLDHPLDHVELAAAGEYYAAVMGRAGLDAEVAQRARDAAAALDLPTGDLGAAEIHAVATVLASATDAKRTLVLRAELPLGFSVWS